MTPDVLLLDVLLTFIGAAGCLRYWYFLQRGAQRHTLGAVRFLVAVIALELALRGVAWWFDSEWSYRLAIAAAAMLPLAITLFVERLLRRHAPLALKLLALATSLAFFACDVVGLVRQSEVHSVFMSALGVVLFANGALLLRLRAADVSANERRLARTLVVVALLSLPLVVTDYEVLPLVPLRLDALAALVFVYVMVSASAHDLAAWTLARRLLAWLAAAFVLAAVFALAAGGTAQFRAHLVVGVPLAYAWLLLSAIVARCKAVSADADLNEFERWLGAAPLDSLDAFVAALAGYEPLRDCRALRAPELAAYDLRALFEARIPAPVTLAWARGAARDSAAEQWTDLLERHQCSLALPIAAQPPLVLLLNLPGASAGTVAYLRAAIVQRIARRLAQVAA